MQVTLDAQRILHLMALLLSSYIIAKLLQIRFEWTPLSAWGLGISISCQVSNAILKIMDPESNISSKNNSLDENEKRWQEERKKELEKRKERRIKGNNEKKE